MNLVSTCPSPSPLREACADIVRHLRRLGYPYADVTTCERMLRAFFPYAPTFTEDSPDTLAGTAFLERFANECRMRELETAQTRPRRCYGQAVELAIAEAESRGDVVPRAPRLVELMTRQVP
jgi:hypothetical protein